MERRSPFSRVRSGIGTGTTKHFAFWMADLRIKSSLQRLKLDDLADSVPGRLASTLAIIRVNSKMRSAWDLAVSDLPTLLSIPQIGPARLAEVEEYLKGRNVSLKWTAA